LEKEPRSVAAPCGTIVYERADYDPRKRYCSYFSADQIAAWLSVKLPVQVLKSNEKSGKK